MRDEGELICIENTDTIILNLHGELKLVKLAHLAKVARYARTVPSYDLSSFQHQTIRRQYLRNIVVHLREQIHLCITLTLLA